jgi:hypothetical protein
MTLYNVLKFLLQTFGQITASLTAKGKGAMGYQNGAGGSGEGFYGNVNNVIKRFLMEGDATATPNASDTVAGSVEIADATEITAGTDTGATGATLAVTPSQLKAVSDNAVQLAEDLSNTAAAPRVAQSTSDTGLLLRNVLNTISARVKAFATGVQIRNAADNAFADIQANNATLAGDVTIAGNLTVQGTTTSVNSTNLEIEDNVITVNKGETGAGVSAVTAGIEVDRGTAPDGFARLVWDEITSQWRVGTNALMLGIARKYAVTLGASSDTHVITHGLGTTDVFIAVYDGSNLVYCDVTITDANNVTLNFGTNVSGFRVVIVI